MFGKYVLTLGWSTCSELIFTKSVTYEKNAIMPLTYFRLVDWIDNEYANHDVN